MAHNLTTPWLPVEPAGVSAPLERAASLPCQRRHRLGMIRGSRQMTHRDVCRAVAPPPARIADGVAAVRCSEQRRARCWRPSCAKSRLGGR